jgi:hypothetical protein
MAELSFFQTTSVRVKLDGRFVGTIKQLEVGPNGKVQYQYVPKGRHLGGERMDSIEAVKQSLMTARQNAAEFASQLNGDN